MTVGELVKEIEAAGYQLNFDLPPVTGPFVEKSPSPAVNSVWQQEAIAVPLVLIVTEPPVKEDCKFIDNYLKSRPYQLSGYARIEGAAATSGGVVIRLQFVRKSAAS